MNGSPWGRRSHLLVGLVLLSGASAAHAVNLEHEHRSDDLGYLIQLPRVPLVESDPDDPTVELLSAEADVGERFQATYRVRVSLMPPSRLQRTQLKSYAEKYCKTHDINSRQSKTAKLDGKHEALDLVATNKNGDLLAIRFLKTDRHIAVLSITQNAPRVGSSDIDKFFGSFQPLAESTERMRELIQSLDAPRWREFESKSDGFAALFPDEVLKTEPEEFDRGSIARIQVYTGEHVGEKGELLCQVLAVDRSGTKLESSAVRAMVMEQVAKSRPKPSVEWKEDVDERIAGHNAASFRATDREDRNLRLFLLDLDERSLALIVGASPGSLLPETALRFLDSFRIFEPERPIAIAEMKKRKGWKEVLFRRARFQVEMPGEPVEKWSTATIEGIRASVGETAASVPEATFLARAYACDWHRSKHSADDFLDAALKASLEGMKPDLSKARRITVDTHPAKEIRVKADEGAVVARAVVYSEGVILLSVKAPPDKTGQASESARIFFDSFRFVHPPAEPEENP